jgi:hypothetical protein
MARGSGVPAMWQHRHCALDRRTGRFGQNPARPAAGPSPGAAAGVRRAAATRAARTTPGIHRRTTTRAVGGWPGRGSGLPDVSAGDFSLGDDLAGIALTAATRFVGRAIGHRMQRTLSERVLPALAAKQEGDAARADRDRRAPSQPARLPDRSGGLPGWRQPRAADGGASPGIAGLTGMVTVEQADALVARLRDG